MAFKLESLLNYDSTTLLLVSVVVLLYTLRAYLQPIPLAHPLLLGRQSDVGRVRSKGETATYRNYGVGHGAAVRSISHLILFLLPLIYAPLLQLPTRPRKDILVAHDVVQSDFLQERTLWSTHVNRACNFSCLDVFLTSCLPLSRLPTRSSGSELRPWVMALPKLSVSYLASRPPLFYLTTVLVRPTFSNISCPH